MHLPLTVIAELDPATRPHRRSADCRVKLGDDGEGEDRGSMRLGGWRNTNCWKQ